MLRGWRVGDEHQSRHARLKNQAIAAVEPQDDSLAEAAYFVDPLSLCSAS
jgi:hypothetical protein